MGGAQNLRSILDAIDELAPDAQRRVATLAEIVRKIVLDEGEHGIFAVALVAAELTADEL